jgi:hypothetical protein
MTDFSAPRAFASNPRPEDVGVRTEPKPCGECSLCCKIPEIAAVDKPAGVWCRHVIKGKGCGIYGERPEACRHYQCTWTWADPLDERWRPDRAGFLLNPKADAGLIEIVVDSGKPDAWRREPYYSQIKQWSDRSNPGITRVQVRVRGRVIIVFPEADVDLGPEQMGAPIQSGYALKDGRLQPYAEFIRTDAGT